MKPWFDRAFGPWYLRLYPHRDRAEAGRALETIAPWVSRTDRVLDVACGSGRHLEILVERGFDAVGIDRSLDLLNAARRVPALRHRLIRGDMRRLPFPERSFATLLSMFTSFGYFDSAVAHVELLREFARVTAPAGRLVLDYLNAPQVRESLVPFSERRVDDLRVEERRSLEHVEEQEFVVKTMTLRDDEENLVGRFREQVALYDREPLLELLSAAGWDDSLCRGDYDGGSWTPESPRLLVIATRGDRR